MRAFLLLLYRVGSNIGSNTIDYRSKCHRRSYYSKQCTPQAVSITATSIFLEISAIMLIVGSRSAILQTALNLTVLELYYLIFNKLLFNNLRIVSLFFIKINIAIFKSSTTSGIFREDKSRNNLHQASHR